MTTFNFLFARFTSREPSQCKRTAKDAWAWHKVDKIAGNSFKVTTQSASTDVEAKRISKMGCWLIEALVKLRPGPTQILVLFVF